MIIGRGKSLSVAAFCGALVAAFVLGWLADVSIGCKRGLFREAPAAASVVPFAERTTPRSEPVTSQPTVDKPVESAAPRAPLNMKAFQLVIWIELKPGTSLLWMEKWQVLAKYVHANEPCTLAYEASIDENDPNRLLVLERYCSKSDLVDVHQKSEAFATFKKQMLELDPYVSKQGSGLVETGIGFMQPRAQAAEAQPTATPV